MARLPQTTPPQSQPQPLVQTPETPETHELALDRASDSGSIATSVAPPQNLEAPDAAPSDVALALDDLQHAGARADSSHAQGESDAAPAINTPADDAPAALEIPPQSPEQTHASKGTAEPEPPAQTPAKPAPPPKTRTRSVEWTLNAPHQEAWRLLSDMNLLNATLRVPAFEAEADGRAGDPNGVWMRAIDGRQRWREAPMEWLAGGFWRIERAYAEGPARRVAATLRLEPEDAAGVRVFYRVEIEPRGFIGRLYAASGLMEDAAQAFRGAVQALQTPEPRRAPSVAAADFTRLLGSDYAKPAARFLAWAASASDADWADFGPEDVAPLLNVSRRAAASLCFAAARLGVIPRRFDLTCPCCQSAAASAPTLREIPDSALCPGCGATAAASLSDSLRVRFGAAPAPAAAAGPRDRPVVLARARLAPGERFTVEAALPPGPARARIDGTQIRADMEIDRLGEAPLMQFEGDAISLRPGAARQPLEMINTGPDPILTHLERLPAPGDRFTAAEAICLQSFRDMFPRDRPAPGVAGELGSVAVLTALTDDLPELCDRLGEPHAGRLLTRARADCLAAARACGGALIGLRDDAAAFVFSQPGDALFAAEVLHRGALKAMNAAWTDVWGAMTRPTLRIGAAAAPMVILSLDDGLGYVGAASLASHALAEQARPGEALLEEPILAHGRAAERAAALQAETIGVRGGCGLARRFRF